VAKIARSGGLLVGQLAGLMPKKVKPSG